nr:InlB B-repeat-containing protein [Alphaproteobacteria bacterium]
DTSNTVTNGRNNTKKSVRTTTQRAANTQTNNNRVINTRTPAVKTRSLINKPNITSSTKITETKSNKRLKTRTAVTNTISSNNNKKNIITKRANASRAATINEDALKNIKSKNLSVCKTTYYNCMDEFCANKDTSLRRCSCSKRIHEFDSIKQQLANFEDKMLDFNQRLLTVSMSKEDAAAINVATEGEQAYQQKDSSESQKILDKITKALNSDSDSKLNTNLSAISLSLNESTAWDNIDSTSGISTASKEGVDLYNAALPVCQEMAKEVCTDDDLNIVQDNYLLSIEQDCNTVSKSYNSQYNAAKDKIYESSALLDMSRLNAYQQKNSDDILTCKSKMLEELSSTSVCGSNLSKCLDTTGRYIDPSTGEAFLSKNLYQLANILQEPKANQTWISVPTNTNFVTFLNSKKTYLTTVLSSCQESADIIWNDFLNDALAQIKIAQNAKLEEVKQSCTTLLTECTTSALKTLEDFDARALSVFNLQANITANNMCSNIKSSCMALMQNTQNNNDSSDYDWSTGIEGITTDILFSKIIENCTLVGQNCIIEQCNGIAGNFSLCTNINSQKYKDIITQKSCWNDIIQCIDQTSGYLQSISDKTETDGSYYYNNIDNIGLGSTFFSNVYDPESQIHKRCSCSGETGEKSIECLKCLIAERIFGNCSNDSIGELAEGQESVVLKPKSDKTTLLYWFVSNTNNTNTPNNCSTQSPKYYLNYNINGTVTSVAFTSERWPIICENNICKGLAKSGYNLYFVKKDEDCGSSSNRYYTGQSYNNPETIDLEPCIDNEPTEYKITYNLDGGTNNSKNPTTYNIKTPSTIIAAPEKSGYTFAGWCTDAERIQNCSTTVNIGGGNTGNITLYAKWEAKGFPITYYLCPVNDTNCEEKDIQNNNPPTYTVETSTIILQDP